MRLLLVLLLTELDVCFQEAVVKIQHTELTDLQVIGNGGFGVAYRAKHPRFGTVVYKELNVKILGERYATEDLVLRECTCSLKQPDSVQI